MDIGDWLRNLGLPQYEAAFREHAIEIDVLSELSEGDLEALGLPLGHRKRLLKAISVLGAIDQKPSEAESELRRMIDHIPVLLAAYRADGSRLYVNQRVRESTDRTVVADWELAPIAMHPDDVALADGTWRACVASGEPFELEIRLRMADGVYRCATRTARLSAGTVSATISRIANEWRRNFGAARLFSQKPNGSV